MVDELKQTKLEDAKPQEAQTEKRALEENGNTSAKVDAEEPAAKRQAIDPVRKDVDPQAALEKSSEVPEDVIEEGRIYFLYRPKVSTDDPKSLDDVQRFFIILSPTSKEGPLRLLAVGKKRLPMASRHERFFGFVMAVDKSLETLKSNLSSNTYETKTRGTRETPAARVTAEGVYTIAGQKNTYLSYKLEVPTEVGKVQEELGIAAEGAMTISIKNPDIGSPPNAGLEDKADFLKDDEKMKQFGNYRWIGCHDPTLLDYPRCEFLLIGAGDAQSQGKEHLQKLLDNDVTKALRSIGKEDKEGDDEVAEAALLAKLRAELQPASAGLPTEPVQKGEWA